MTLEEVLDLMDDEVWVRMRIRTRDGGRKDPEDDLVLWSADWIGGGLADPGMPTGLEDYLDWDADDLSVEMYDDPEFRGTRGPQDKVPMIVVNAYEG